MSSNFSFGADGTAGPFKFTDQCVLVVGDTQTFGGGTLAIKVEGNGDAYTLASMTEPGQYVLQPGKAPITLALTGSTSPSLDGAIWPVISR